MTETKEWPAIVHEYASLVWQTAFRLLGHDADTADCFQETFVSAWQLAQRQRVQNWPGLLHRLATARALDRLRRRHRESRRRSAPVELAELPSSQPGPQLDAQAAELAERLREALAGLPPQQSQSYCLRHLSGLSYEQIGAEMGISINAVGGTLHRATARLRAALAPITLGEHEQR